MIWKQEPGKDVRLTIVGEDTEVDKTIVDNIQDPIMHIVRNSMDHGIEETAQERIAAGKDPQGRDPYFPLPIPAVRLLSPLKMTDMAWIPRRFLKKPGQRTC